MISLPAEGTHAPDFTLPATNGADITLSAFRGTHNVLIAFFPEAFTGTCTAEMCDFSTDDAVFEGKDTAVLPITTDTLARLQEFKAKERMTIELLSDDRRTVSRQYGAFIEERNHPTRAYILVDKGGVIRWAFAEPNPGEKRSNAELLQQIEALG